MALCLQDAKSVVFAVALFVTICRYFALFVTMCRYLQLSVVSADKESVVSADKESVVSAEKNSVVSADKKSVVSADKISVVCHDIPMAWTIQGRPPSAAASVWSMEL